MNRIDSIVSYIEKNDKVIDVGCDQAEVSIKLALKGQSSIASDISNNVINKAREKIDKLNLGNLIKLKVSDGLNSINEEVDTLVLAGMGTHTILEIIKNTTKSFNKIITISNRNNDVLRLEMNKLNYKVSCEQIIFEKNKYYNLILFIPGNKEYSEEELLLGYNHQNRELFDKWVKYLVNKYMIIKQSSTDKNEDIDKILNILNSL